MTLIRWLLISALVGSIAPAAGARPVKVKLATLAPDGSPWHELLKDLGARWEEVSDGQVQLHIFAGGVAGDELDVLRKLRIGQLGAAAFSIQGLGGIDASTRVLIVPRMVRSDEEFDVLLRTMAPLIEARIEAEGFHVMGWFHAGWVRTFLPRPMSSVEEVQKVKLLTWAGDQAAISLWKQANFRVIPLPATEILTGLQTGLVEAINTPPAVSLASQSFRYTPAMLDLKIAPLPGALVLTDAVWQKIPEELRPRLRAEAERIATDMRAESSRLEEEAIASLVKRGVIVVEPSEADREGWDEMARGVYPKLRGSFVPEAFFDKATEVLRKHRARQSGKQP